MSEVEETPVQIVSHQDALKLLEHLDFCETQQVDAIYGAEWTREEKEIVRTRDLVANDKKKENSIDLDFQ